MNKNRVKILVQKEWLELKNDKATLAPLLILPIMFSVILPSLLIFGGVRNVLINNIGGVSQFLKNFKSDLIPSNISAENIGLYALLIFFFMPLFLLIPIMISTVLASSSFVGEKEKRTIEGLLYTPLSDSELLMGKLISVLVPSVLLTWASVFLYGIVLDVFGYGVFEAVIFPTVDWVLMMFVISPLLTFFSTMLVLMVSQRSKSSKSAQSVAMILLVPIIGMMISQASGLMVFGTKFELILAIILIALNVITFKIITKMFVREKIVLNS